MSGPAPGDEAPGSPAAARDAPLCRVSPGRWGPGSPSAPAAEAFSSAEPSPPLARPAPQDLRGRAG